MSSSGPGKRVDSPGTGRGSVVDASYRPNDDGRQSWTIRVNGLLLSSANRVGLPVDVAAALGCLPGQTEVVSVIDPPGCASIRAEWQVNPTQRTVLSGMSEALWRVGALNGDLVSLSATAERLLEIRKLPSADTGTGARETPATGASARMVRSPKSRPTVSDDRSPSRPRAFSTDCPRRLAPWGAAPTPPLPRWYLDTHGEAELPAAFTDVYPRIRRLRDLRHFWEHYEGPLDRKAIWPLRGFAERLMPPGHLRVLGTGIGLAELDRLPLLNRTRNCVRWGFNSGALASGTVDELMRLPNFGIASLLDLMCVLETAEGLPENSVNATAPGAAAMSARPMKPAEASARTVVIHDATSSSDVAGLLSAILPRWSLAIRSTALTCDAAELVVAAARELRGATSLGDLLRLDLSDLITAAEADSALAEVPLEDEDLRLADRAVGAVDSCVGRMSDTERLVALERVAASEPKSLQEIAGLAELSRERIRQLDRRVRAALEAATGSALGLLSLVVSERLGAVTTRPEIESVVVELLPSSGSDAVVAQSLTATRRMLLNRLDYECREGLCLSRAAADAAKELNDLARQLVDDEGLLDLDEVRAALAEQWHDNLDDLIRWIGWPRVSGRIALRATARARTKAALLKIGAPATKAELATESGLSERQVAGALSNIKSVARADKLRWGLREWIDDVYEGISAEIIQRIEEDGGSTRLNRVLDELPRKFGVSENSVRAYMATPKFVLEDGRIRLRREYEEYHYQNSEIRDAPGVFALGDGVVGLLYEVDRDVTRGSGRQLSPAAGALLDLSVNERLRFDGPHGTSVTVTFPGTSSTGPSLGSTRGLAEATNAKIGDMLTVILHRAQMTVSATATDLNEHDTGWALVARLTGISENAGMDGLATALHCSRGEVRATLRARRDTVVLEALPERRSTPDLEEALAALDAEMQREEPS